MQNSLPWTVYKTQRSEHHSNPHSSSLAISTVLHSIQDCAHHLQGANNTSVELPSRRIPAAGTLEQPQSLRSRGAKNCYGGSLNPSLTDHYFASGALSLWNNLLKVVISDFTVSLIVFKCQLKTALYCLAYTVQGTWLILHLCFLT